MTRRSLSHGIVTDLADQITVLVTTSPVATGLATDALATTVQSVLKYDVGDCRLFVGADGVRPAQRDCRHIYESTLWAIHAGFHVKPLGYWGHQANVLRMLLKHVTTPLVLFLEHDTPLTGDPIDWQGCADTILDGELDAIRFHYHPSIRPDQKHLTIDPDPRPDRRIPYLRTAQWSQRPHLARTDWYRDIIATYFARSSRCHVEDVMQAVVRNAWATDGMDGWDRYRLGIYADPEPTMQRSTHLDARAGSPKLGQTFAYESDEVPAGAPWPTLLTEFPEFPE